MTRHIYWNALAHSNVDSSKKRAVVSESGRAAMFCKNQKAKSMRIFLGQLLDSVQTVWSTISLHSASTMSWISAHQGYVFQIVCLQFDDVT
ncbi:hypothetical protein TNCT_278631 [Trichonephila clavata]|uniref:Uncharacterized protein n=1 Tax=Trichonephila clavata TaxID=2740835 RepID=A0A8X6J5Y6_TRICU|nr:hypothetical protein TNCT_278631 [Trichonephila clavata]